MGSGDRSAFDALDLEIIDRVYEAAWAKLVVLFPGLTAEDEAKKQSNLRKRLFALAKLARWISTHSINWLCQAMSLCLSARILSHPSVPIAREDERSALVQNSQSREGDFP